MAHIKSIKKIYSDGRHSAFTDMEYWKGQYYVKVASGLPCINRPPSASKSSPIEKAEFSFIKSLPDPESIPCPAWHETIALGSDLFNESQI